MSNTRAVAPAQPRADVVPLGPDQLLARAIDKGVPVETLERLLALREKMAAQEAESAFNAALAAFQAECPVITRSEAVKNRDGRGTRYRYAPLETIVTQVARLLERHGFSYRFDTRVEMGNPPFLICICVLQHVQGHSRQSEFRVPVEMSGRMNAQQEYGSAGTYAKRYAFINALGILTGEEDDDANSMGQQPPRPPEPAVVSAEDLRTLEARIKRLGYAREKVLERAIARANGRFKEFREMTPAEFQDLNAQITHWERMSGSTRGT